MGSEYIMSARGHGPHDEGVTMSPDSRSQPEADLAGSAVDASSADANARILQILSTEHWSLLAQRSLVYNEAFTRVGTFLTLMSMSLVALALLAQAMTSGLLVVAALTLGFDLLVGLATIGRVLGAVDDDLRAMHGMSRIRHGYVEVAPELRSYFTTPVHDDVRSVMAGYGKPHVGLTGIFYFLSTSLGLMVLLVSVLAGVLTVVAMLAAGATPGISVPAGVAVAVAAFVGLGVLSRRSILAGQSALESRFPADLQTSDQAPAPAHAPDTPAI
jgi:hypothetical protein